LLLSLGVLSEAQQRPGEDAQPRETDPYEELRFKAAVFGPSDEIFIWWGHAALIVENTAIGYARIFDWGIFSYPSDSFLKDFALNRVRYKCAVSSAQWDIDNYTKEDRDIVLYTLDLDSSQKKVILDYAENNVLPENCWYIYHQFNDNCSTRIRDLIDLGTGGEFKSFFEARPGRFTLREHMRRFSWYSPFYDWFLGFLLGRDIDRKVSMWDEMFLPVELGRNITGFSYIDESGNRRALVSGVEVVNRTKNRRAVLDAPRAQWPRTLAAGLTAAVLAAMIIPLRKKRPRAGRLLRGLSQSLLGLASGGMGTLLFFASRAAERDYMRHNSNLLFVNPLLLAAIPLGICAALNKTIVIGGKKVLDAERGLWFMWLYVCAAGFAAGLANLIPRLRQDNLPTLVLLLPSALVFVLPELNSRRRKP
jgi:hypothetical protein